MFPDIIEACDEIVSFNNKINLLKSEIGKRQVSYNIENYEGFNNKLYGEKRKLQRTSKQKKS